MLFGSSQDDRAMKKHSQSHLLQQYEYQLRFAEIKTCLGRTLTNDR